MRSLLPVPVLLALWAPPVTAQWLPAPFPTIRDQTRQVPRVISTTPTSAHAAVAVLGGLLGGTAGLLGGALLGSRMGAPCQCEDAGLVGMAFGGLIGESVGMALGTYLGDRRRGNLALDLLASAGGAALGLALTSGVGDRVVLIPAVAFQIMLVAGTDLDNARQRATAP